MADRPDAAHRLAQRASRRVRQPETGQDSCSDQNCVVGPEIPGRPNLDFGDLASEPHALGVPYGAKITQE